MKYNIYFFYFLFFFTISGCNQQKAESTNSEPTSDSTQVHSENNERSLKVFVFMNGDISSDGKIVSLEQLDSEFKYLSKDKGIVFYSKENIEGDGPEESMKVIDLVAKYELPVQFYTDSTFREIYN